jgi:hypothetical protein
VAFGALGRFRQFSGRELEPTGAATGGFDDLAVFRMFEAFEEVIEVIGNASRRFINLPGDLAHAHWMIQQQVDQVFAKHTASGPLKSKVAAAIRGWQGQS